MINQTWITNRVDAIAKDLHRIANSLEVLANDAIVKKREASASEAKDQHKEDK